MNPQIGQKRVELELWVGQPTLYAARVVELFHVVDGCDDVFLGRYPSGHRVVQHDGYSAAFYCVPLEGSVGWGGVGWGGVDWGGV